MHHIILALLSITSGRLSLLFVLLFKALIFNVQSTLYILKKSTFSKLNLLFKHIGSENFKYT
ncbi:hypothetical protein SAMN06297358_3559 [Pedobacter xixiisoli]|uniref:Uncharacterized protein n=1 Tax=Pedobacter xixiisoli TaxID=1476464 RepID=A0A286AD71_9SPHI|nr:hypothetical protein SAMN06297358_3559 [Pedobacter xixiisoli]